MTASLDRYDRLVDAQRTSRVWFGSLVLCLVFLAFSVNSLVSYDAARMAATSLTSSVVALSAFLALISGRSVILAANLLVASIACQVFGEMLFNGSLQAPATPIALLIVPAAVLTTSHRCTIGWAIFVVIGLIGIAWLDANGLTFPLEITGAQVLQDKTVSMLIGVVASAALTGLFATQASQALNTLAHERAEYARRAMHDALTSLPNRTNFCESASLQIRGSQSTNQQCTLVFLDVNGFKQVNDGLGHEAGDELLVAFARRLELSFESPALVGRFAGDEFVVFVAHDENSYRDSDIGDAVAHMVSEPFYLAGAVLPVGASFGIARLGRDGESLSELLAAADQSMYVMKRSQASARADANQDQPTALGQLPSQVLT